MTAQTQNEILKKRIVNNEEKLKVRITQLEEKLTQVEKLRC